MIPSATLALLAALVGAAAPPRGSVRVKHAHLVAECLGGTAVPARTRAWPTTDAPVTLTFTMRNEPRTGIANAAPGHATVTFTPLPGHRYDAEVRADATTFARRVWPEGAWTPVVRDRTTDAIVSGPPTWGPPPCAPASGQR